MGEVIQKLKVAALVTGAALLVVACNQSKPADTTVAVDATTTEAPADMAATDATATDPMAAPAADPMAAPATDAAAAPADPMAAPATDAAAAPAPEAAPAN